MLISENISIKGDKKAIFNILKDFQAFPSFMQYIISLKVTKNTSSKFTSDWNINIDGVPITWKEEDTINDDNSLITFSMVKGDYKKYEGKWEVTGDSHNAKIKITADIDWGAPAFTAFPEVKKTLSIKTRKALKGMMLAIKRKIEHPKK